MARGFNYAPGASAEVQEASLPGLDKARINELAGSRNPLVRVVIAARTDCPLGLMVTLAHDYSAEVRASIARNPTAQRTVMAYLSADRSVDVLTALLENPALPDEILEELAFHKKGAVRGVAAARLDRGLAAPTTVVEDVRTPELAEHVLPVQQRLTADGMAIPAIEPANVVDITTRAPVQSAPAPVAPSPDSAWAVPQIFSPHSTPDAPAPTRTAPVRGFKPKD
jgi:hypothetical protein